MSIIVFDDFKNFFPLPGITRRRVLGWIKQGKFPAGTRPAGAKSDVHWNSEDVIHWFTVTYSGLWPQSVERVKNTLGFIEPTPSLPTKSRTVSKTRRGRR